MSASPVPVTPNQPDWFARLRARLRAGASTQSRWLHDVGSIVALLLALVVAQRPAWLALWGALLAAHLLAVAHWRLVGPRVPAKWPRIVAAIAVASGAALCALLLVELLQRSLQRWLLAQTLTTPWEGLVSSTVWLLVPLIVALLVLAAYLAWRALAHAVLDGKVSLRVPFEMLWAATGVALFGWAVLVFAPAGLAARNDLVHATADTWVATAAAHLSLFVDAYGQGLIAVTATYLATQLAYGLYYGLPDPRLGALVVVDLGRPGSTAARHAASRKLLRLANVWREERGPCVLVRVSALTEADGGLHTYWADAAGDIDALFVNDPWTARRWIAHWMPRSAGSAAEPASTAGPTAAHTALRRLLVRECYATDAALPECLRLLAGDRKSAFLVLTGSVADAPASVVEAQAAASTAVLPKAASFTVAAGATIAAPALRLRQLPGGLDSLRDVRTLVAALEGALHHPTPVRRVAVVGRPRSDAVADRFAAKLDGTLDANGSLIDAVRPQRGRDAEPCDVAVVLLDPPCLAGQIEALAEARALEPLARAARTLAVVTLGTEGTTQRAIEALRGTGIQRETKWLGSLPERCTDADLDALVQRFVAAESLPSLDAGGAPLPALYLAFDRVDTAYSTGPIWYRLAEAFDGQLRIDADQSAGDAAPSPESRAGAAAIVVAVLSARSCQALVGATDPSAPEGSLVRDLKAALARGVPVLPVLIDNATMPAATLLPEALRGLARLQAVGVDASLDRESVVEAVRRVLQMTASAGPGPHVQSARMRELRRAFDEDRLDDAFFAGLRMAFATAVDAKQVDPVLAQRFDAVLPAIRETLALQRDGRLAPHEVQKRMAGFSVQWATGASAGDAQILVAPVPTEASAGIVGELRARIERAMPGLGVAMIDPVPPQPRLDDALRSALVVVIVADDFERTLASDLHRSVLAAALAAGVPVLPLTIGARELPSTSSLPPELRPLLAWQALPVRSVPDDLDLAVRRVSTLLMRAPVERALRMLDETSGAPAARHAA